MATKPNWKGRYMRGMTLNWIGTILCGCMAAMAAAPVLWQQDGILISDLGKFAEPKANVSREQDRHKWELVDYETTRASGTMLYSRRGNTPAPVTIDPGLKGWYRIYAATFAPNNNTARLWMRVDGEPGPTMFTHGNTAICWSGTESCEEIFMECADLTDRKITIGKPAGLHGPAWAERGLANQVIGLMWLRFEPMTEQEVADYQQYFSNPATKRLHAHSDMDWIFTYGAEMSMDEYCSVIDAFGRADVGMASVEVYSTLGDMTKERAMINSKDADLLEFRWPSQLALDRKRREVYKEYVRRAEGYGMKLLAAHRMGLANFIIPADDIDASNIPFVTNNPQWYCRDRDGEPVAFMSYAYPEVGDFMIREFLKMADYGFHGATLALQRGIVVLFEEPVIARFKERYPDLDPFTLSLDDERLASVRCEFFTDFLRRMRKAFDEYSQANGRPRLLIVPYIGLNMADNRRLGLDVETWVKEKLVDSVCVAVMRVFEDERFFKDDANPERISVEKYHHYKMTAERSPIQRSMGNQVGALAQCAAAYRQLSQENGVRFYYDAHWEGTLPPEQIADYALQLYKGGAEYLSLWNSFEFRVSNRPEWFVTSRLGHRDDLPNMPKDNAGYRRRYRMLSLNGTSYASYYPNWRG